MSKVAKVVLLAAVLLVLAFVLSQLRRFGGEFPPAANVSGESTSSNSTAHTQRVTQQPTILHARPPMENGGYQPIGSPLVGDVQGNPRSDVSYPPSEIPDSPSMPASGTTSRTPSPAFEGDSWPVSRPLSLPSPFQLDRLEAAQSPPAATPAHVLQLPPQESGNAEPAAVRDPHPASVRTLQQDSFWDISRRVYGVGDYYKALYYHNRQRVRRPDSIDAGLEILTPPEAELRTLYPALCP
jgi:hypothetical protein